MNKQEAVKNLSDISGTIKQLLGEGVDCIIIKSGEHTVVSGYQSSIVITCIETLCQPQSVEVLEATVPFLAEALKRMSEEIIDE